MERYNIIINPEAEDDLNEIADYLSTLSEQAAIGYYNLIIGKINDLSVMPERCPFVRDPQLRLRGYRALLVKNYIVFYVITGKTVEIRRTLYARRQYVELL